MLLHGLKHLSEALGVAAWQSGLGTREREATLGMSLALHRLTLSLAAALLCGPQGRPGPAPAQATNQPKGLDLVWEP